ncbi:hypothetical protein F5Y18DRAFT_378147, partial [Xylariaceae sp. FL1019]
MKVKALGQAFPPLVVFMSFCGVSLGYMQYVHVEAFKNSGAIRKIVRLILRGLQQCSHPDTGCRPAAVLKPEMVAPTTGSFQEPATPYGVQTLLQPSSGPHINRVHVEVFVDDIVVIVQLGPLRAHSEIWHISESRRSD